MKFFIDLSKKFLIIIFMKRRVSIILHNEYISSGRPIVLNFEIEKLKIFSLIVVSLFLFSISVLSFSFLNNLNPESLIEIYSKRDFYLSSISKNLNLLENNINRVNNLIEYEKKLRILANLDPLSDDIRQLGLGGYQSEDPRFKKFDPLTKRLISNVDNKLMHLEKVIEFEKKNFTKIGKTLDEHYNLLKHTPSIVPTEGRIMSGFGYRIDPFTKGPEFHTGIDIANQSAPPIYASADGEVIYADYLSGYGKTVKIDHGYGYITVYAHMSAFNVKVGDKVKRHQLIGYMGSTGRSTGTHLHYEVRIGDDKINPIKFIDFDSIVE
uniref:M23 family metallopeptidase n=1 Tax=candidate division WOR-3 bacterium TaxID=2052148 RepID=A0A7C3N923_UNCW3